MSNEGYKTETQEHNGHGNVRHSQYSVTMDTKDGKSLIVVEASAPFWAVSEAAKVDGRFAPFTWSVGLSQQNFDWGTRFERNQICVDVKPLG